MADKSPRRQKLEQSLVEDPQDTFLRYGVGVQCLRDGDIQEGRAILHALIADHPDDQVAAHQQLGQSYTESEEFDEAVKILRQGIAKAQARGDLHSASEMEQLLGTIE